MLESVHPNLLALAAAVFVAAARMFYRVALGRLTTTLTTLTVNVVSVPFAAAFYWLGPGVPRWPLEGILWFVVVGLVGSLFGRYMSFQAIRLVGVARTSVAMQTVLVFSTALAVIFLGERLSAVVAAGSVLILCGGVFLVFERGEVREKIPLVYYLAPLLTAMSFAITFILRRYGLAWIPSSPLGMGTANLTAGVILAAALPFTGEKAVREGGRGGLLFAVLGGILNAAAALCFWTAVQMGEVVQVVPINRLSVLFVIIFSWLFFRKQEFITLRLLLGAGLSVAGAFVIAAGG